MLLPSGEFHGANEPASPPDCHGGENRKPACTVPPAPDWRRGGVYRLLETASPCVNRVFMTSETSGRINLPALPALSARRA